MTYESPLAAPSMITGNEVALTAAQIDVNKMPQSELSELLERCRVDLKFMDSLLGELERPRVQNVSSTQIVRIDGPEKVLSPHAFTGLVAGFGADSVRRVADDIENLSAPMMVETLKRCSVNYRRRWFDAFG